MRIKYVNQHTTRGEISQRQVIVAMSSGTWDGERIEGRSIGAVKKFQCESVKWAAHVATCLPNWWIVKIYSAAYLGMAQ
jgi:hypothetical protein